LGLEKLDGIGSMGWIGDRLTGADAIVVVEVPLSPVSCERESRWSVYTSQFRGLVAMSSR
jgi:hypothetical protein